MMRYVSVGNQIADDDPPVHDFAFFNTVNNRFIVIDGDQVFHSRADFDALQHDPDLYARLVALIPEDQP